MIVVDREKYDNIIESVWKIYVEETMFSSDPKWLEPVHLMNMKTGEKSIGARQFSKIGFIHKCKTDSEFSEKGGLKIEERELNKNQGWERYDLMLEKTSEKELKEKYKNDTRAKWIGLRKFRLQDANYLCDLEKFPTKLITITYNNEKVEVYE